MRYLLALVLVCLAAPAAAQDQGIYIFDFAEGGEPEHRALASRIVSDAGDIADAVVIYCGTSHLYRARDHRHSVQSYLVCAGADPLRVVDAGVCTPDLTGRGNDDIGDDSVWLALTNGPFLEQYRRERLGY